MEALLIVLLGGRAAEEVILNELYSISADDLLKITKLIYKQVKKILNKII